LDVPRWAFDVQPLVRPFLIVLLAWAALYLPWLGSSGLRSEEGHRVLPAIEMLESGNYLVPHVAGEPYLRKPPLINWLVAACFKATGQKNEWTARLPSVLSVLVVAVAFVTMSQRLCGARGALVGAVAWLTSLGMLEKGRMIEIEALYVSLFAVALLCWLTSWHMQRSPWLIWTAPYVFLGFGLLAKGPAHLIFFYAVVGAILWRTNKFHHALHAAHFAGIVVMLAIFTAWAWPATRAAQTDMSQTWSSELANRFTGSEGTLNDWLLNWPLALAYFVPAGLLLPFVRFSNMPAEDREIARGLWWGSAVPFVAVLLLPGAIQRYVLPTLVPACLLVGLAVKSNAFTWFIPRRAVFAAIAVIGIGAAIIFPLRSATVQKRRPAYNAIAARVNDAVPPGEILYAVRVGYQPFLFYLRNQVRYLRRLEDLPADARFFLAGDELEDLVGVQRPDARFILRTTGIRHAETLLYRLR
jgi:4-amino-4-deoxy-L-arabinose transferase-like glycosyltransferase